MKPIPPDMIKRVDHVLGEFFPDHLAVVLLIERDGAGGLKPGVKACCAARSPSEFLAYADICKAISEDGESRGQVNGEDVE